MSNCEEPFKATQIWATRIQSGILALFMFGIWGCVTSPEVQQDGNQEKLGLGIVLGTRGYQEVQKELASPGAFSFALEGQVIKIEGAAYVVKEVSEQERRVPFDQNTTIDRPAHIGDWIAAYLDSHGRATHIRNIDQEIIDRESPFGQE